MSFSRSFLKCDRGATASEYALILALIVVGLIAAMTMAGANISTALAGSASTL